MCLLFISKFPIANVLTSDTQTYNDCIPLTVDDIHRSSGDDEHSSKPWKQIKVQRNRMAIQAYLTSVKTEQASGGVRARSSKSPYA